MLCLFSSIVCSMYLSASLVFSSSFSFSFATFSSLLISFCLSLSLKPSSRRSFSLSRVRTSLLTLPVWSTYSISASLIFSACKNLSKLLVWFPSVVMTSLDWLKSVLLLIFALVALGAAALWSIESLDLFVVLAMNCDAETYRGERELGSSSFNDWPE